MKLTLACLFLVLLACTKPADEVPDASLAFVHDGRAVRTLSLAQILTSIPKEEFQAFDPYYVRDKRYRAVPLAKVIELGFKGDLDHFVDVDFVLRAKDGYAVPLPGAQVMEPGGYIAFRDLDAPAWEPIGPQHANPGPFYVVWKEKAQASLETHPRPWQLASIEISPFEKTYPHVVPTGGDAKAMHGFALFRGQCFKCHAMNQEGGHVGPELNVPQSIVEYRPEAQIRAYIRNPLTFRYGNMPAHPMLTEGDLDDLIAYFQAMKALKHDPKDAAK